MRGLEQDSIDGSESGQASPPFQSQYQQQLQRSLAGKKRVSGGDSVTSNASLTSLRDLEVRLKR